MRRWLLSCTSLMLALLAGPAGAQAPSAQQQRTLDQAAFAEVERALQTEAFGDVQSVVVLQRGRLAYEFHRDGSAAQLREVASVTKSVLSTLAGIAIGQGRIASLDQPVLELMPEWAGLNADAQAGAITLRHLLTMTAGFRLSGTGLSLNAREAWARPLRAAPGQVFGYDNALVPVLSAILEKVAGQPLVDYARRELAAPLGIEHFEVRRGLRLRTLDMARLGQLFLQKGRWEQGRQIVPEDFVNAATRQQNAGGAPLGLPYGFMWWVVPGVPQRQTYMAAGFGGQLIWVHEPLGLVVAVNSTVSLASNERGQALRLVRQQIFAAAQKRAAAAP
jgi:CubicO group peptidase (beta-lactamase class C family)